MTTKYPNSIHLVPKHQGRPPASSFPHFQTTMHERSSMVPAGRFKNRPAGDHKSWNSREPLTRKVTAPTTKEFHCGSSFPLLNVSPLSSRICSSAKNHSSCWKNPVHLPGKEYRNGEQGNLQRPAFSKSWSLKRCSWISHCSDPVYVGFHDEQWGVPVYDEHLLFEMLVLSGMLSEYTWTEILINREAYRNAFFGYDPSIISMMDERQISNMDIVRKAMPSESRIRCIINNSKCVLKIEEEHRSFSTYMWRFINYTPIINVYKYPRNIPLKTSKAMAIGSDLVRRGFRFVGPTIIHAFMQAAGMTIDHLIDCFRYEECVNLAESPWGYCICTSIFDDKALSTVV